MNHVYKVVFNKAIGAFIAVAEYAKGQGKKSNAVVGSSSCCTKSIASSRNFILSALAANLMIVSSLSSAAVIDTSQRSNINIRPQSTETTPLPDPNVSTVSGIENISIGNYNKIDGYNDPITAGVNSNIAIGRNNIIDGGNTKGIRESISLGALNRVTGTQSTAIGNNVELSGDSSIAIGGDDLDEVAKNTAVVNKLRDYTGETIRQGEYINTTASGAGSVVIGVQAQSTGDLSTAFGTKTKASGTASVALGVGADASKDNAVALGAGSKTDGTAKKETTATVNSSNGTTLTYDGFFAGAQSLLPGDQVSVGSAGHERQIKNVAPGAVNQNSTDAINGSQLYSVAQNLGNVAGDTTKALGGGAAVNPNGTFKAPTYNVLDPNNVTQSSANNVGGALNNLNIYVNRGFKVLDNGAAVKGTVTPGESVQFKNGDATTAVVENETGGVTAIKYDVKYDGTTIRTNSAGQLNVEKTQLSVTNGKVNSSNATATEGEKLVSAENVANTINQSGFTVTSAGNQADGSVPKDELVNPGDKVTYSAGKNITVDQSGDTTNPVFEFATADDVTFTNVTSNNVTSETMTVNTVGDTNTSVTNKQYVDEGRTKVEG
ncbi:ESPR-type extended signal peptide-containing protein, partial [Psychrobacter pacificensis]